MAVLPMGREILNYRVSVILIPLSHPGHGPEALSETGNAVQWLRTWTSGYIWCSFKPQLCHLAKWVNLNFHSFVLVYTDLGENPKTRNLPSWMMGREGLKKEAINEFIKGNLHIGQMKWVSSTLLDRHQRTNRTRQEGWGTGPGPIPSKGKCLICVPRSKTRVTPEPAHLGA